MGLLGIVERHSIGSDMLQKFKTPYEDFSDGLRGNIEFFLIHPALREYINELHKSSSINEKYELYVGILVGSDLPWTDKNTELYKVNKLICEIKNLELQNFYKSLLEKTQKDSNCIFQRILFLELKIISIQFMNSEFMTRLNGILVKRS